MARTSKIALITATALAMIAVLTGSLLASAESHAATVAPSSPSTTYAAGDAQSDGVVQYAGGGQNGRGVGRGDPARGGDSLAGDVERVDGWNATDVLQWIAIAILAGLAAALLIWRPWRPDRGQPVAVDPAAYPVGQYDQGVPPAPVAASMTAAGETVSTPVADAAGAEQETSSVPGGTASQPAAETVAGTDVTEITQAQPAAGATDSDDVPKPPAPPAATG